MGNRLSHKLGLRERIAVMLDAIFLLIFLTGFVLAFAYFITWYYGSASRQDITYFVTTPDGWRLAIHRYIGLKSEENAPIVLCHGLSSNRFIFDMEGAPSLACYLRDSGYDVWVPELRGSGMSQSPGLFRSASPYEWGYDDHLKTDLPVIIDFIRKNTRQQGIHWIGHSMGGMLIDSYLATKSEPKILSAITIGSPVDFSNMDKSVFSGLMKLRFALNYIPFNPMPIIGRLFVPFMSKTPNFVHGLYYRPNTDPHVARKITSIGSELVSSSKLWLDMASFFEKRSLSYPAGISFMELLRNSPVPLFVIAGSRDSVAPPESVSPGALVGSDSIERKLLVAGKNSGMSEDYGHLDLLIGIRVQHEIYPLIRSWIQQFQVFS